MAGLLEETAPRVADMRIVLPSGIYVISRSARDVDRALEAIVLGFELHSRFADRHLQSRAREPGPRFPHYILPTHSEPPFGLKGIVCRAAQLEVVGARRAALGTRHDVVIFEEPALGAPTWWD